MVLITAPWRNVALYHADWALGLAVLLFAMGLFIYSRSGKNFSAKQLGGLPEVNGGNREQRLVTDGIRARASSGVPCASLRDAGVERGDRAGSVLGANGVRGGYSAVMIRLEDAEWEQRFGDAYREYRRSVPALIPRVLLACASYNPLWLMADC